MGRGGLGLHQEAVEHALEVLMLMNIGKLSPQQLNSVGNALGVGVGVGGGGGVVVVVGGGRWEGRVGGRGPRKLYFWRLCFR